VAGGELRIVPTQELGQLGLLQGAPTLFRWHWCYHTATAPLWALILLLLVIPKANRNRQAWLILIPLVAVLALWHTFAVSLGMSAQSAQFLGILIVSGTMAWTAVWLLGHWLGSRYGIVTFFLIHAVMFAVGALSLYCSGEENSDVMPYFVYAVYYSFAVFGLVTAMMLAGRLCRKRFSPIRFGLWLLLWIGVVPVGTALSIYLAYSMLAQQRPDRFVAGLMAIPTMAAFLGGIVYLINLPFLILGLKNPFYRRRLEAMFRGAAVSEAAAATTLSIDAATETECVSP
jgi:hypothetical protein